MSLHKIPLSDLEKAGLLAHGLDVGIPSQLSDAFRLGMNWVMSALAGESLRVGNGKAVDTFVKKAQAAGLYEARAMTGMVNVDYRDNPGMGFDSRMLPREAVDYRRELRGVLEARENELLKEEPSDQKFISSTVPLGGWVKKDPESCRIETQKECGCAMGQCARGLIF